MAKKSHAVAVLEARVHNAKEEQLQAHAAYSAATARLTEAQCALMQVVEGKPAASARKPRKGAARQPLTDPMKATCITQAEIKAMEKVNAE